MKPLYPEDFWRITVHWSRPVSYERASTQGTPSDDAAHLYLISARFGDFSPKVLYIGKVFDQWIRTRLQQHDHRRRREAWQASYPRHKLLVSAGCLSVEGGRVTRKHLDAVERILIYSSVNEHTHNVQHLYQHGVSGSYEVANTGSRSGLPRVVAVGMFYRS